MPRGRFRTKLTFTRNYSSALLISALSARLRIKSQISKRIRPSVWSRPFQPIRLSGMCSKSLALLWKPSSSRSSISVMSATLIYKTKTSAGVVATSRIRNSLFRCFVRYKTVQQRRPLSSRMNAASVLLKSLRRSNACLRTTVCSMDLSRIRQANRTRCTVMY